MRSVRILVVRLYKGRHKPFVDIISPMHTVTRVTSGLLSVDIMFETGAIQKVDMVTEQETFFVKDGEKFNK